MPQRAVGHAGRDVDGGGRGDDGFHTGQFGGGATGGLHGARVDLVGDVDGQVAAGRFAEGGDPVQVPVV